MRVYCFSTKYQNKELFER